jgi:hypothetical protein
MVKPPLRTKSIGFKVSEEEYALLETEAQAEGRTLGEWCREAILRGGSSSDAARHDPALAEIVGVRLLLVNVLRPLAAGEKLAPIDTSVGPIKIDWYTDIQATGPAFSFGVGNSVAYAEGKLVWTGLRLAFGAPITNYLPFTEPLHARTERDRCFFRGRYSLERALAKVSTQQERM